MKVGTVVDVWNDMEHGVYNMTDHGKCIGCGDCCSNMLPMTEKEIKRIKKYIKAHGIKAQKNLLLDAVVDMTCPFMLKSNTDKKCLIYGIRPEICKCFKCDDPNGALKHKELYKERRTLINVRETFYSNKCILF